MTKFVLSVDNQSGECTLQITNTRAKLADFNWKWWVNQLRWFLSHTSPHGVDFEGYEMVDDETVRIKYTNRPMTIKADM